MFEAIHQCHSRYTFLSLTFFFSFFRLVQPTHDASQWIANDEENNIVSEKQ
jgi:hypothetical protein